MYNNILDIQHSLMRKFARWWFDPYMVTSTNDKSTYHSIEHDWMRLLIPIVGKQVKIFKKTARQGAKPQWPWQSIKWRWASNEPQGQSGGENGRFTVPSPQFLSHNRGCVGGGGSHFVACRLWEMQVIKGKGAMWRRAHVLMQACLCVHAHCLHILVPLCSCTHMFVAWCFVFGVKCSLFSVRVFCVFVLVACFVVSVHVFVCSCASYAWCSYAHAHSVRASHLSLVFNVWY